METYTTKQLATEAGIRMEQFYNLRFRYPERFRPLNPGARVLQWDRSLLPVLVEIVKNLRTYKGKRPENTVRMGWVKKGR